MNNIPVYMQPHANGLNQQQYSPDTYDDYQGIQAPDYNYTPLPSQRYLPPQMFPMDDMPNYIKMPNVYPENNMDCDNLSDSMTTLLERYIGRVVKAEFVVGDKIEERVGRLTSVGASYIIISAISENVLIICDRKTLKFVTVILSDDPPSDARGLYGG